MKIHKYLFTLSHEFGERRFLSTYKYLMRNQWSPYQEQKMGQEEKLHSLVKYSYENVPYYHKLLTKLGLTPEDIKTIKDLEKLPVLNKETIKKNWDDFKPQGLNKGSYYVRTTGGSTGTPFEYRLTKFDRFLAGGLLYRGWGYGGYELGDKMVFLSGTSLGIGTDSNRPLSIIIYELARNIKKLSSFNMNENSMQNFAKTINDFKPKFIRGYPSSIYLFSSWLENNDIKLYQPLAVFTTSETLYPHQRDKISEVFNCEVYNTYGLFDGGVSAYECPEHQGLHIDTERSIMEVADSNGEQLDTGTGSILATSLYNYAMPFIRYDTGDIGNIIDSYCACGRGSKLLKEIIGRTADILITPEGEYVHAWFFLYIFMEHFKGIKEYQVIQETLCNINIKIVPDIDFNENQLDLIRKIINKKSPSWRITFEITNNIERTRAGKFRFIINKTSTDSRSC